MDAREKLVKYRQEHLLKYFDELDDAGKQSLLKQIEALDFDVLASFSSKGKETVKGKITPLSALELSEIEAKKNEYREAGLKALKEGKLGAILLAGGMGTRLGSNEPKGMFDIGLTKKLYIFECLMNNIMDVVRETGRYIHLFVMTSELNDQTTREFFKEQGYFGYPAEYITFFRQEMSPCCDEKGKVLLERKDRVATSPNGNGGWFLSLMKTGVIDRVKENGIEWLNVFAVDNVLQRICDPVFVGATILEGKEVGAKVVRKNTPDERVGVMCLENGHPSIVEYYELTDSMRDETDEKGERVYNFGVILNYLFKVSSVEKIVNEKLPYHVVNKKIPYLDASGNCVEPEAPNGFKFEQLVLDMIHLSENCLPFEVVRDREFAPIKNKTGVDSVESARELLQKNGVEL
ncbi:MAG: UDPGP type 1 family protein [Lachnospiraceae bacterium]|nr:UDPGP type 1 family protein [Lachnospiraceae bacterium]